MIPTITPIYAALAGLLLILLTIRVGGLRGRFQIGIGDGGNEELARWIRVHGNFIESVPLALLLILLVELQGVPAWRLHALGAVLLLARLAHAQGLSSTSGRSLGRAAGAIGTLAVILVSASSLLYRAFIG
ncbi:MAG: MAPEG family protein [Proteobacteria bacterium]|nr:MAPEG family protein [Pseudomonadota bacterium]MBI3497654.1 MAPEG family protein [Pseudomonadota bacterium]